MYIVLYVSFLSHPLSSNPSSTILNLKFISHLPRCTGSRHALAAYCSLIEAYNEFRDACLHEQDDRAAVLYCWAGIFPHHHDYIRIIAGRELETAWPDEAWRWFSDASATAKHLHLTCENVLIPVCAHFNLSSLRILDMFFFFTPRWLPILLFSCSLHLHHKMVTTQSSTWESQISNTIHKSIN